jgi:hypothetical protein
LGVFRLFTDGIKLIVLFQHMAEHPGHLVHPWKLF